MTTGSRPTPFRIPVEFQGVSGLVLLDQIRTLDNRRLARRLGATEATTLAKTLATLRELFED